MGGIRIGGSAVIRVCSPPMTAFRGSGNAGGESAIWRACTDDAPGTMTEVAFTDFADVDQNSNPRLSPNGRKIAFQALDAATNYYQIWVVNSAPGSTPVLLAATANQYLEHPAWLDNNTVIFVAHTGGLFTGGGIYSVPAAGGTPTLLLAAAGGYTPKRPQANFDGSRIAYIWDQDAGTDCDLRVMDADGSNDASLDTTISGYLNSEPPQFSWALASDQLVYSNGVIVGTRNVYVIQGDGTGKTQLNANGDAAGVSCDVSHLAWAPADAFVVVSGNRGIGNGLEPIRCEVDGSTSVGLAASATGPANRSYFRTVLVYASRIWWIRTTQSDGFGRVDSCALDGSDERTDFNSTLGTGDQVVPFGGGDGWYFN